MELNSEKYVRRWHGMFVVEMNKKELPMHMDTNEIYILWLNKYLKIQIMIR